MVVLKRRGLSSRLPYGPYIALGAAVWIFAGPQLLGWYQQILLRGLGAGR